MSYTNNFQSGTVYSFDDAANLLTGRNKDSKKLANNTYLVRTSDGFAVKLHDTNIVTINKDGTYTLNSGGWLSMTTKARMNEFAPVSISQSKGVWYLRDGSLYSDGMTVNTDGDNVAGSVDPAKYEQELAKIKKTARKYAKDFVKALQAGTVAMPSAGDCWYCALKSDGTPLGDKTSNNAHLLDHIEENYFVPSMLVNAGREAGYRDDQIGLMGIGGHRLFIDPENNIYKYLVKRLRKDI